MARTVRLTGLLIGLLALASCGDVTRETIDKWNGSKVGFEKMEAFITQVENDQELRLYALEALVREGFGTRARGILRDSPDRETLADLYAQRLLGLFTGASDEEQAQRLKDALLASVEMLPEERRDRVRVAVAAWAFAGLGPESDARTVQEQVEKRISISQLPDLGLHGADGAALLLSRGFAIDRVHKYLVELERPEITAKLLAAYRVLHHGPDPAVPVAQLEAIEALESPAATAYLLELYANPNLPETTRGDAFALAIRSFSKPGLKDAAAGIIPGLYRVLETARDDDRRLAAHYILRLGGVDELAAVLATFRDDGAFAVAAYDTPRFARDFCRDDILKLRGDPVPILFESLGGENRVARLLSLVCIKLSQRFELSGRLKALRKDATDMADLVAEGVSFGQLAMNAAEGLEAIAELARERDEGRLAEEEFQRLRALYEDELVLAGKALRAAVKERRAQQESEKAAKP